MSSHQDVFGFIHPGRQIGGAAVVGMGGLHHAPMRARDFLPARALREAEKLAGFVLRHRARTHAAARARARAAAPRVALVLRCLTPTGEAAVEVSL